MVYFNVWLLNNISTNDTYLFHMHVKKIFSTTLVKMYSTQILGLIPKKSTNFR